MQISIVDDPVSVGDDQVTLEFEFSLTDPEFGIDFDFTALSTYWTRAGNRASVSVTGPVTVTDTVSFGDPDEDLLADVAEQLDANLEDALDEAR